MSMRAKFRLQLTVALTLLFSITATLVYAGPPQALIENSSIMIWVIGVVGTAFGSVNLFLGFFMRRYVVQNDALIKTLFEMRNEDHDKITILATQFKGATDRVRPCGSCDALTRGEVKEIVQDTA